MRTIPNVKKDLKAELDFLVRTLNKNIKKKRRDKKFENYVSGVIYGTKKAIELLKRKRDEH
jgi:hypothetical protein